MNEIIRQDKHSDLIERIYDEMTSSFRTLIIRQETSDFVNMWSMLPEAIQKRVIFQTDTR